MDGSEGDRGERVSEVGYRRPPKEHQFRKGQKPPPRKKRKSDTDMVSMFWRVLQEHRRGKIEGKLRWAFNAELIVWRAFEEGARGSSTLNRLLNQFLLEGAVAPEGDIPEIILVPERPELRIINLEVSYDWTYDPAFLEKLLADT